MLHKSVELSGAFGFSIYDGTGRIYDGTDTFSTEPSMSSFGEDDDFIVEIAGDRSMFQSDPIFSSYTIEVVEDNNVIVSTDERIHGIGYPIGFSQDGTSGEIEIAISAVEEVKESWSVMLGVTEMGATINRQVTSEFNREGDKFVTTFDSSNIEPSSEGASIVLEISIYSDGVPTSEQANLWFSLPVEIDGME